jgi:transcriptional regulator with XRE-family HTH domain
MGHEVRIARYRAGMTQRQVGAAVGRTGSWISLIEATRAPRISVAELTAVAAAVGLKLYLNIYPLGRRPLDAPQLDLLAAFNARISPGWNREIEKVMPREGDLRAVDEYLSKDDCSIAVEAITRLAVVEAQLRSARAKQRDLDATRLVLLLKASHANRSLVKEAGPVLRDELPIGTREALRALAAGRDPGRDCLILL